MIFKVQLVKTIYTPVEIEAEDMQDAVKKAYAMMPDTDWDQGDCNYTVGFSPEHYVK